MNKTLLLHLLCKLHSPVVLCFHSVGQHADALDPKVFRAILLWLIEARFKFLLPQDLLTTRVLRRRTVLLTFDDGRKDNYTVAWPILRELGVPAAFYVCPELLGRTAFVRPDRFRIEHEAPAEPGSLTLQFMDWSEVRALGAAGMCIGSHTNTHALLTALSDAQLVHELEDSRWRLERELNTPVTSVAYPWGQFDARVISAVKAAGYEIAMAGSVNAKLPLSLVSEWTISRITVPPNQTWRGFRSQVTFSAVFRRAYSQLLRGFRSRIQVGDDHSKRRGPGVLGR